MAAYASLVSLMHNIDQILFHPRPPISLDKTQVESLTEKVTFLQEFLESYSHVGYTKEPDIWESRIADAAYAAEDIIESHIVDHILAGSTSHGKEIDSINFYQNLEKVIEEMDSIKEEVMEIKEKVGVQHHHLHRNSSSTGCFRGSSTWQNTMVGLDDVLLKVMDRLIGGQLDCQIIPISGMGGIGKTTLARNIYQNQVVLQHFDILVWVTISQQYRTREILLELLQEGRGNLSKMDEYELGVKLHKRLSGRRYLIILDDIWDIELWDQLKFFFPDNNNGSRIMLTTRLSNLASQVADSQGIDMAFLDENKSWNLFSKIVFGEDQDCPLELEKIGKKIVKNCNGLPLSIVVIGGLLAKSKHTREYWDYIAENLNSVVNSEDNESCLNILHMSYNQLPIYLKLCFLYMGVFKEDSAIRVSTLIDLWVVEGIIKPISGKSLEEIAKEYLHELVHRNLILVHKFGCTGNIKYCNIHDLLRDLCLREAQKERFYNVIRQYNVDAPQGINTQRRVVISKSTCLDALQAMSLARSLIYNCRGFQLPINSRLLRILKAYDDKDSFGKLMLENMFQLVNSRYLAVNVHTGSKLPSSVDLLWNLQTLVVGNLVGITVPAEIWNMSRLRHVKFVAFYLPDPPSHNIDGQDDIVLENLQTLVTIINFKCGEEVVKRIPNIKKLGVNYMEVEGTSCYHLNNLDRLHKLESFGCNFFSSGTDFVQNLTFPHSLKKLSLGGKHVNWEDMLEKIGSLPLLEKLTLISGSFQERKWETVDGQFRNLKFLLIWRCRDLECWTTESFHFPRLEHLLLYGLKELREIPSEIGEIPTLQSISMESCSDSVIISAKRILEEQVELGNEGLHVRVLVPRKNEVLERLAISPNFRFECQPFKLRYRRQNL